MDRYAKLLVGVLSGTKDANIPFADLCKLLERLDFHCRIKGDHFIFTKPGVDEIINLQPRDNMAKPYQVKQVRQIILKYRLGENIDA